MIEQVLSLLSRKIGDRRDQLTETIANGSVNDYASYREIVGVIRGLATCEQEIEDLVRRYKEDDDE
jgi:hypothetical protein